MDGPTNESGDRPNAFELALARLIVAAEAARAGVAIEQATASAPVATEPAAAGVAPRRGPEQPGRLRLAVRVVRPR